MKKCVCSGRGGAGGGRFGRVEVEDEPAEFVGQLREERVVERVAPRLNVARAQARRAQHDVEFVPVRHEEHRLVRARLLAPPARRVVACRLDSQ